MALTRSVVLAHAREYAETEPLYTVEQEHVDLLPEALRTGEYGWRDVEWVVQWFFRRHLGAYPDADRRAAEEAFRENEDSTVRDALTAVTGADDTRARLAPVTELSGVSVPVASALLLFMFPRRYVVVGEREWRALRDADELDVDTPETVDVDAYLRYQNACETVCRRLDVDAWTLYRALWRLGATA